MPDENRVFDISKPGQASPSHTSKPVIVGHRPTMADPMVRDSQDGSDSQPGPTKINVHDDFSQSDAPRQTSLVPENSPSAAGIITQVSHPWDAPPARPKMDDFAPAAPITAVPASDFADHQPEAQPADDLPPLTTQSHIEPIQNDYLGHRGHVEELHMQPPKKKSKTTAILIIFLLLFIGAYLVLDSGLVKTGIDLPFHIFKQKAAPSPQPPAPTPVSTVPVGFTKYSLADTNIVFAAPTAWGSPSSTTDQGYSARGGSNKPDGNYAYLVNFDKNKDIQIAVTSSKYLPPPRDSLYYDFLQWCTGTNDKKTYLSFLHFTTSSDKIDTPATITCDQGPITSVTQLNATTIVQLNAKDAKGTSVGDLYTKNLTDQDFPVFRVKDAAMTNSANIKQLLTTIKAPSTGNKTSQ